MCLQRNCHNTIKSQHCGDSPLSKNEGKTQKTKSRLLLNHRDLCWHSIARQHKRVHTKQQRYLACIWLFTKLLCGAPPTQCKTTRLLPIKILRVAVGMISTMGGKINGHGTQTLITCYEHFDNQHVFNVKTTKPVR